MNNKLQRCGRTQKLCYPSLEDAKAQLEIINMIGPVWRMEKRMYRCKFCGCWHLTSQRFDKGRRTP